MTESRYLYEKVIMNDYCIGCGNCASVTNAPFKMHMNEFGNIVSDPAGDLDASDVRVLNICPFSDKSKSEDDIVAVFFKDGMNKDPKIGMYLECFAGFVNEGEFRERGSSGGFGKWLGYTLLNEKKIDFFIQVLSNTTNDPKAPLFDYVVTSKKEDIIKGSKSSYYPVTLVDVIKTIKDTDGRYAITGVPCFIKALRLMSIEDETIKKRIRYTVGIVCGGMKSANQSKIIGWQLGVKPENLVAIDFRRKHKDKPASHKIYQVWSNADATERFKDAGAIYGTDWGSGFFKPNACDYCDDVVAETADVSFGDAWLPQYEADPRGTSMIIVRNNDILDLLYRYKNEQKITLYSLTPEDAGKAQDGGFRHRREALSFRIGKKAACGKWYPPKRVRENEYAISKKRKKIYSLREKIAAQSHISGLKALSRCDLNIFYREIDPLIKKYRVANYGSRPVRALKKIKRMISGK